MTSKTRTFSDEELTTFLDGEAGVELAGTIEQALRTDTALQQRYDELKTVVETLPAAFDPLLKAAPAMPDLPQTQGPRYRFAASPVLIAASLVVGIGIGFYLTDQSGPQPADWMQSVAEYQVLYVPETLMAVDQSANVQIADLENLGQTLGLNISSARSDDILDFKRGQLLGFEGQPLVQLAYLAPGEVPVALCIIELDEVANTNVTTTEMLGMAAAHWQSGSHAFLLIGRTDKALIHDAAERFALAL